MPPFQPQQKKKIKNFKKTVLMLWNYAKGFKLLFIFCIILGLISAILNCLSPIMLQKIIQNFVKPDVNNVGTYSIDVNNVMLYCGILLLFYVIIFLNNAISSFFIAKISAKLTWSFRNDVSNKINKIPLKYFDSKKIGETTSILTNDIDTFNMSFYTISNTISNVFFIIGLMIAMLVTSWQLGLIIIATIPLIIFTVFPIIKFSQKYFVKQQADLGKLNGKIDENFNNLNVVKIFNANESEKASFNEINNKLEKNNALTNFFSFFPIPISLFFRYLGLVLALFVCAILISNGTFEKMYGISLLPTFLLFANLINNPLQQLAQNISSIQMTFATSEKIFDFLDLEEEKIEKDKIKCEQEIKGKITFKNVIFSYNENKQILKNISFEIEPGKKVAIVGPTGSGKTTIINLLMHFYECDSGDILIDDVSIYNMYKKDLRNIFSMVLQDTYIFEDTIKNNIKYNLKHIDDETIITAAKNANVDHFINTLDKGYDTLLDEKTTISAGEKQLITIARAILQNNPILILDEATSNVDTKTELLIQDAVDKLTQNRTSIVIAHRLSTIKNADLILVLKDGHIIEQGNHSELLEQNGFYKELYESQFSEE
ncbi:MAG: ABC transporter ATP-binding protein/permease [Mycoplasmataceae bacterium]|nr:ABC transporter ATP-binding protein/permease [Mycoplasmataceae bacterium]